MKKLHFLLSVLMLSAMLFLLTGCGGAGVGDSSDSEREENSDTSEEYDEDEEEDIDLLRIRYHMHEYDLNVPFSQLYEEVRDEDCYLIHYAAFRAYDENGEFDDSIDVMNMDFEKKFPVMIDTIDDRYTVSHFPFEYAYLDHLRTGDKMGSRTKEKDLPDYYIPLGSGHTGFDTYGVLIIDGKICDIEDYIDDLPDSVGSDLIEDVRESMLNLQPRSVSNLSPLIFRMQYQDTLAEDYENDRHYKNNFAFLSAVEDAHESVLDGDSEYMAVIYLSFRNGEFQRCNYHIFRDTYGD